MRTCRGTRTTRCDGGQTTQTSGGWKAATFQRRCYSGMPSAARAWTRAQVMRQCRTACVRSRKAVAISVSTSPSAACSVVALGCKQLEGSDARRAVA